MRVRACGCVMLAGRDDQQMSTMQAAQQNQVFQALFENSSDAIWMYSKAEDAFVDCNQSAIDLFGLSSKQEALAISLSELGLCCQTNCDDRLVDCQARRIDGTPFPIEILLTETDDSSQAILFISVRDISARKRHENKAQQFQQELELRVQERTVELIEANEMLKAEIAERKNTELLLRDSEDRSRIVVEHAPEAILVYDCDTGRFVDANPKAEQLFKLKKETILATSAEEMSPEFQPDGRKSSEVIREKLESALAGGTPVFEWVHLKGTGAEVHCEVRMVRLPSGKNRWLRGSITDITERKRKESIQSAIWEISEAVHKSEDLSELYKQIHQSISRLMPARNFYIALVDGETGLLAFPYFVDERDPTPLPMPLNSGLTGCVIRAGKPMLISPAHIRRNEDGVAELLTETGRQAYLEWGSHSAIWLGVPLRSQGKVIGVLAVQDYTDEEAYSDQEKQILNFVGEQIVVALDRKKAADSLQTSEEKFRSLFENTSQAVVLHDESGVIGANSTWLKQQGFQLQEVLGKQPADLSAPIQANGERADVAALKHMEKALQTGSARFEWLALRADGTELPMEVFLTPIKTGDKTVIQAVCNDISVRTAAEREVLNALNRERELSKLKTDFVSMVSHEFRTPLGIILSSAEILESYFEKLPASERVNHLTSIQKSSRRMATLMEEVLVLSRVENGTMAFQPQRMNFTTLLDKVIHEVEFSHEGKCRITSEIAPDFSETWADIRLVELVFNNLLSNAVKYSPAGNFVTFRAWREGSRGYCTIQDEGIGISEADLPLIFQAFQRGGNVGSVPGTGLGLVIVKRCLDLQKGEIRVKSVLGEGTTFTVLLPLFSGENNL